MRNGIVLFIFFVLIFGFFGFGGSVFGVQYADGGARHYLEEPEAMEWLKGAASEALSACGRYRHKSKFRAFIHRLYEAGASYAGIVYVLADPAGLRVQLPFDEQKRKDIFDVINKELEDAGQNDERDTGQSELVVWFK
jgi:hypothetical protein